MAFPAHEFIFDNISSDRFGLFIADIGDNGQNSFDGVEYDVKSDKVNNSDIFNIFSKQINQPLAFTITVVSKTKISRNEINIINNWLFPYDKKYRKLFIKQENVSDFYYNCIFTKSEIITFRNYPYAFKLSVVCDSQFVWENERTIKYNVSSLPHSFNIVNHSSEDTLKPTYIVTSNKQNGSIVIKNNTSNQDMKISNLNDNETVTINTRNEIIESSLNLLKLKDFTTSDPTLFKNFMKLQRGLNNITISGDVKEFKIKYQNAYRYGGGNK